MFDDYFDYESFENEIDPGDYLEEIDRTEDDCPGCSGRGCNYCLCVNY